MRRAAAALVALGACAVALVAAGGEESGNRRYRIVVDNAFGLVEGGDFRIGGVRAGSTVSFDLHTVPGKAPKAVVVAEVTRPGFDDLRSDATCEIKPQSLVGEFYVDCQAGSSPKRLPDGGTIPVDQTASTVPLDLVNSVLRRPYRERLRLLVAGLGTGLAGRADDLQAVVRRAHPGLRETQRVLRVLGEENRTIEGFLRDADTVVAELERHKRDATRFIVEAGAASEVAGRRRAELRETVARLPAFLAELRPSMARLGELAGEQAPLLADLQRAAPDLETFLARLGPFARAARPALRELGGAAQEGTRAFEAGEEELAELRILAAEAPGTARPLRQFLETMDDRRRAIDDDPRATVDGPPARDPSHAGVRGGFTGFEALANYFFWQTLSANGFDQLGHVLRAGITANKCSPFHTEPPHTPQDEQLFADCNSWLGPSQPGITTPDPSAPPERTIPHAGEGAPRRAGRQDAGRPAAPWRPQPALPPDIQQLLDSLAAPTDPAPAGEPVPQILDFLLGP